MQSNLRSYSRHQNMQDILASYASHGCIQRRRTRVMYKKDACKQGGREHGHHYGLLGSQETQHPAAISCLQRNTVGCTWVREMGKGTCTWFGHEPLDHRGRKLGLQTIQLL